PKPRAVTQKKTAGLSSRRRSRGSSRELEVLQNVLRRGYLEGAGLLDEQLLDDAAIDDHGIALAARAQAELRALHGEAHRLGELAIAVAQHQDLVACLLVLAPGTHHERVVDGNAGDGVDTLRLQLLSLGHKTGHVFC